MLHHRSMLQSYLFRFSLLLLLIGVVIKVDAQQREPLRIAILMDEGPGSDLFVASIKKEIDVLLGADHSIDYTVYEIADKESFTSQARAAYASPAEIILSAGIKSSLLLSLMTTHTKPTISGILLDDSTEKTSGRPNYTYIRSPFSVSNDLKTFKRIVDFKHLAVFETPDLADIIGEVLRPQVEAVGAELQIIQIQGNIEEDTKQLREEVDAVYVMPYVYPDEAAEQRFIDNINQRGLPSFALIGRQDVENGVLAGQSNSAFLNNYARRMAINVLKITNGEALENFPVDMATLDDDLVINVKTARQISVYPSFDVLSDASLIDADHIPEDAQKFTLEGAVLMALNENLQLDIAEKNIALQDLAITSAKSGLLPQLTASATSILVDNNTANSTFNAINGELSLTGNLSLSQVILAEPLLANVAIQKLLKEVESESLRQTQLDIVQNTASAYLGYLLARANARVQLENVEVTKQNLGLAKNRERIGTASAADKYRFESQLAQNSIDYNDAQTAVEQAKYNLNLLLNRPKEADLNAADLDIANAPIFLSDPRISQFVNNQYEIRKFGDFLVDYALEHLPEIKQIDYSMAAQERGLLSNKRSLYLPQVALVGNANQLIGRYMDQVDKDLVEMQTGIDPFNPTWNASINASLPIFQGYARKADIQSAKVALLQLEEQKDLLQQSNETFVRSQLENVANSFGDVQLNQKSAEAARSYLTIVQDLYQQGVASIATLLDAQNSALLAELGLINAQYQLIIDGFQLENAIGFMHILSTPDEREALIQDFQQYLIEK